MASRAPTRRSDCPISFALEIFGDRWTLLVLRDVLIKGRRRFSELLAAEEAVATNVLADRLRRLERRGLLRKESDPEDRRRFLYRPTKQAIALLPMLVEMIVWGARNDPHTAADTAFVRRFTEDREGLLRELEASVGGS